MEKFLSVEQIAEWLGVSPKTVYRWKDSGLLPHYLLGRCVRFRESDVEDFLEGRRVEGGRKKRAEEIAQEMLTRR